MLDRDMDHTLFKRRKRRRKYDGLSKDCIKAERMAVAFEIGQFFTMKYLLV